MGLLWLWLFDRCLFVILFSLILIIEMAHSSDEELFEDEIIAIQRYQVQPFMFEPGGEDNTDLGSGQQPTDDSSDEEEPDINLERIGNTAW